MSRRLFIRPVPETNISALGFRVWRVKRNLAMASAHTHSDVEVNFLFSGEISYLHSRAMVTVRPLRFTAFWAGIPHWLLSQKTGQEGIWITLPLAWLLEWQLPRNLPARLLAGEVVSSEPNEIDRPQLEKWVSDFETGNIERRRVMLLEMQARFHRLAFSLPARASRKRTKKISPHTGITQIEKITDHISRHYREPLRVDDIARAVGLHGKYLMRLFKRHSDMSVWEYVTRLRLSHAQRLLLTTDLKIIDIALDSGFASLGPFYRAFARYSPGARRPLDYRRRPELKRA